MDLKWKMCSKQKPIIYVRKISKPINFWCICYRNIMCSMQLRSHIKICDFSFSNFLFANMTDSNGFDLLECHSTLNKSENTYIPLWLDVNAECWQVEIKSLHFNDLNPAFVSITSQWYMRYKDMEIASDNNVQRLIFLKQVPRDSRIAGSRPWNKKKFYMRDNN